MLLFCLVDHLGIALNRKYFSLQTEQTLQSSPDTAIETDPNWPQQPSPVAVPELDWEKKQTNEHLLGLDEI